MTMTEKQQIRVDLLSECLSEYGITLNREQLFSICNNMVAHIQMESEAESYAHIGTNEKECPSCSNLKHVISELEKDILIYKNSVKQRRNAEHVWIENGKVKYE